MAGSEFMGSTVGLTCNGWGQICKLVKVHFTRNQDETVTLQPVSGWNMADMRGKATISAKEFEDRPYDPYDQTREALWALGKCGWEA